MIFDFSRILPDKLSSCKILQSLLLSYWILHVKLFSQDSCKSLEDKFFGLNKGNASIYSCRKKLFKVTVNLFSILMDDSTGQIARLFEILYLIEEVFHVFPDICCRFYRKRSSVQLAWWAKYRSQENTEIYSRLFFSASISLIIFSLNRFALCGLFSPIALKNSIYFDFCS